VISDLPLPTITISIECPFFPHQDDTRQPGCADSKEAYMLHDLHTAISMSRLSADLARLTPANTCSKFASLRPVDRHLHCVSDPICSKLTRKPVGFCESPSLLCPSSMESLSRIMPQVARRKNRKEPRVCKECY